MKKIILLFIVFLSQITNAQVVYIIDSLEIRTYKDKYFSCPIVHINGDIVNEKADEVYLLVSYYGQEYDEIAPWTIMFHNIYCEGSSSFPYVSPGMIGNYLPEFSLYLAGFKIGYSVIHSNQRLNFPMSFYFDGLKETQKKKDEERLMSTLSVDVNPYIKDTLAYQRISNLLDSAHGQEEYEICPMYKCLNKELLQFINGSANNVSEKGFCTIRSSLEKNMYRIHIDYYDTPLFSKTDLQCLKHCYGCIDGTNIPTFLVGRQEPCAFKKEQDSELSEAWKMFKRIVKDNQRTGRKEKLSNQKVSVDYWISINEIDIGDSI